MTIHHGDGFKALKKKGDASAARRRAEAATRRIARYRQQGERLNELAEREEWRAQATHRLGRYLLVFYRTDLVDGTYQYDLYGPAGSDGWWRRVASVCYSKRGRWVVFGVDYDDEKRKYGSDHKRRGVFSTRMAAMEAAARFVCYNNKRVLPNDD